MWSCEYRCRAGHLPKSNLNKWTHRERDGAIQRAAGTGLTSPHRQGGDRGNRGNVRQVTVQTQMGGRSSGEGIQLTSTAAGADSNAPCGTAARPWMAWHTPTAPHNGQCVAPQHDASATSAGGLVAGVATSAAIPSWQCADTPPVTTADACPARVGTATCAQALPRHSWQTTSSNRNQLAQRMRRMIDRVSVSPTRRRPLAQAHGMPYRAGHATHHPTSRPAKRPVGSTHSQHRAR